MIKKNTKIVFEDNSGGAADELMGGIPLSKGEIVKVQRDGQAIDYEVEGKKVEIIFEGEDQIANITYTLRRK